MANIRLAAIALGAALLALADPIAVRAGAQAAIDGCIDRMRAVGGPDAQSGGQVLSQEWSQAGTLVRLRDAGGTVWECIGYDDGAVGDLRVVQAMDDGGGAMAGAATTPAGPVTVHFQKGASGATYDGTLAPGDAIQYRLGARNEQFLTVHVTAESGAVEYQIWNPDDTRLLDLISSRTPYKGQLWQSGTHVVDIVNRTNSTASYRVEFAIR